jgi:Cu+-exporting ATPase
MKKLFFILIIFSFISCESGNKSNANRSVDEPLEVTEVVESTINISGMHCDNCVVSVEKGINGLEGIAAVTVSLNDSMAVVKYDKSKVKLSDIEKSIEKRGYTVKQ